jgi:hypothetical protein
MEEYKYIGPYGIVIIILLYIDGIVLMLKNQYDLCKKLIILKELCSSIGMTVNTKNIKVVIIKSKRITYNTFFMTTIAWRECLHENILESISTNSIGTIALKKG